MTTTPTAPLTLDAAPGVESCVAALVHALQQEKGWLHGYADSIIRDAIDRVHLDAAPEQLLPCPFCGAQPKVGFHGDEDGGYHYAECTSCRRPKDLEAERFIGVHAESESDAIAAWNRRPQAATIAQLEARLREAKAVIRDHNTGCETQCEQRKQNGAASCPYTQYGRLCPDCPRDWLLDAAIASTKGETS